jgi:putative FmdB family regulatory protein
MPSVSIAFIIAAPHKTTGLCKTGDLVVPIYEYRCESCDHKLEKLQKMSEGDLVDCPECKHPALKRLVSAPAFRLKGSGWYETDFKKDNKRNLADESVKDTSSVSSAKDTSAVSSTKTEKTSSGDTAKKAETKPAAKTASKE